jgi:large subunit ribosomal protein L25
MSEITLTAEIRKNVGKRARALRRTGKVPGIYYGHGQQNIPVSIPAATLKPLYSSSATHVIDLKLDDGSSHLCVLRDVQLDPITEKPVHFDLFGLTDKEALTIEIPVKLIGGIPKGVKEGGILQQVLHKLKVSCLPKFIPDHVEIDVSNLEMNRSVHAKDLAIPNVTIMENATSTIVAVVPPVVVKEPEPTAAVATTAEAPAEPEVIATKGKKLEEGAEVTDEKKKPDEKKKTDEKKK